jgi:hypothetical protein
MGHVAVQGIVSVSIARLCRAASVAAAAGHGKTCTAKLEAKGGCTASGQIMIPWRARPLRTLSLLFLALFGAAPAAAADCVAVRGAPRPRLVELYTSEGCSSCPPADEWLRRAPQSANVAALAFHVDYWDSLGWRDRFANPRFTRRQEEQSARDGGSGVYTPQIVLDGRSWSGWHRSGWPASTAPASATMRLAVSVGPALHVRVDTRMDPPDDAAAFRNFVAVTEDGLASDVRAGENRGAVLRHDHVVRAFVGPLPLSDGEADIALPKDVDRTHAILVAFAQRSSDGAIAQVLTCAM